MKFIVTCALSVLFAADAWPQATSIGYFQSSIDGRVFELRTRGDVGMDVYDTSGKLQTAMERRKRNDDYKGVTYTLATSCPNNAGKIETTEVTPDRISMRVELPNTSLLGDVKGDKSTACFKIGLVRWQSFALVRTAPPKPGPPPPAEPAPVPQPTASAAPQKPPNTAASNVPSGSARPDVQVATPSGAKVVEARRFSVTINACRRSASSVICNLTLVNKEPMRDAQLIAGSTRIITVGNRAYAATEVVLAGVRNRQYSQATLLQGLPAEGELVFENVPPPVKEIHLLELSMWARDVTWFTVPYTGIVPIRD